MEAYGLGSWDPWDPSSIRIGFFAAIFCGGGIQGGRLPIVQIGVRSMSIFDSDSWTARRIERKSRFSEDAGSLRMRWTCSGFERCAKDLCCFHRNWMERSLTNQ
jgi:hypothetical protein